MLTVSDAALNMIADAIDASEATDDQAVRLAQTGDGEFGLMVAEPQADDQVVTRDNKPVLYVASEVSTSLDGATLDITEGAGPTRLTIRVAEPGAGAS